MATTVITTIKEKVLTIFKMVWRSFRRSKKECLLAGRNGINDKVVNYKDKRESVTSATLEAAFIFLYTLQMKIPK